MVAPEVKVPVQPADDDGTRPVPVTAPPTRPNPLREGLRLERMAEPCTMIICGATGDLTERKLGPALYNTLLGGFLPPEFTVVGFARRDLSDEDFRKHLLEGINKYSRNKPAKPAIWESFARGIEYHRGEFDDPAAYAELAKRLERIDRDRGTAGNRHISAVAFKADLRRPPSARVPEGRSG